VILLVRAAQILSFFRVSSLKVRYGAGAETEVDFPLISATMGVTINGLETNQPSSP
jgi:hypothetical protein